MAKMYAIKESPGKGRGVFATKAIPAGTNIMKDRVGLKVDKDGPSVREADVLEVYDGLSKADQDRFLDLHDGKRQYNKIFRIWKANVFGGEGSTCLYFKISLINHACVPNAEFGTKDNYANIIAVKSIAKGEEVFITYNSLFEGLSKRHRANTLRLYYGFECSCSVCALPEEQQALSDCRRQLLNVLKNALEGFQPINTKIFDFYGTLDGQQAEHPAVLNGISRLPLAKPLSLGQTNAYRLLTAGLLVAEGHSKLLLADAYDKVAEALLNRMQVLDDIVSLQAVRAVETWMQFAIKLARELCGTDSLKSRDLQQMWKYMKDSDQMSAAMLFLRSVLPEKRMQKDTFAVKLGNVVNGGLHLSDLSEDEYWAAVRQKRRQGLLS